MSKRKRILVIEDHQDSRRMLARLLGKFNFDVLAYESCGPAAGHLGTGDIDIALLDVRLPGRCGDDFGNELQRRWPGTMVVFVTGESDLLEIKAAVPGSFVLQKPIDIDRLLKLLASFEGTQK